MKKLLLGMLVIPLTLCIFAGNVLAFDISDFDPAIHCANPLAITTDEALAGVMANVDDYAVEADTFRVLCFDPRTKIEIRDTSIAITNTSPLPLIVHGLWVVDHFYSSTDPIIQVQGSNIILHNAKIIACMYFWIPNKKGLRFVGSSNMLINSDIYGFAFSLEFIGDSNTIDGGIYDNVRLFGHNNSIINSRIDGCSALNGRSRHYYDRTCSSDYIVRGGIFIDCPVTVENSHLQGPFCTIANSEIINTKYAVKISNGSGRVLVSQNNIPADKNQYRIYDNNLGFQYYNSYEHYQPVSWHKVGITNAYTYAKDGGFWLMGTLEGVPNVNPLTDRVELFRAKGDHSGFVGTCPIFRNNGADFDLMDIDRDIKYTVHAGALYFNCGFIDIGRREEFSFTYTDSSGSTSLYTRPATVELDWHYHCAGSIAQFDTALNPEMIFPGIRDILKHASVYASDFPRKRVLCFPDESYDMGICPSNDGASINNNGKKLIAHNLHMRVWTHHDLLGDNGPAALNITGENIKLIGGTLKKWNEDALLHVGIHVEGRDHEIANMELEATGTCIDMEGYGHTVTGNDINGCTIGVYADCAWPDYQSSVKSSCVIGPDNYFYDLCTETDYSIYLPSTARNVTFLGNEIGLKYCSLNSTRKCPT